MKTNNLKKILSIVIISIVLALVAVTVVLAVVPKSLYNPLNNDFQSMVIYRNGSEDVYIKDLSEKDKTAFANVVEMHEKSLTASVLSNMFQGTHTRDVEVLSKSQTNVKTNVVAKEGVYAIEFRYADAQTLKINGEEWKDSKTFSGKTVSYNKMYLIVTNNDSYEACTIYLTDSKDDSSYQISFLAHQEALYEYITNLKMSVINA